MKKLPTNPKHQPRKVQLACPGSYSLGVSNRLPSERPRLPRFFDKAMIVGAGILVAVSLQSSAVVAGPIRWGADSEGGAPYVFKDPEDPQKTIGFEVDIAEALSREIAQEIVRVQYDYGSLIVGLERGDLDIAMNGIEITPDREARILFSSAYYVYRLQLTVKKNDHRYDSLEMCRKNMGVVGTLGDTAAERLLDAVGVKKRVYEGQVEPYSDLELGRIDAVLLDLPIAAYYASPKAALRSARFEGEPGKYAIAVRKDNTELQNRLNNGLRTLAEHRTLEAILRKWNLWNDDQRRLVPIPPASGSSANQTVSTPPPAASAPSTSSLGGSTPSVTGMTPEVVWSVSQYLPLLLAGLLNTVLISVSSMAVAIGLGLLVASARVWGGRFTSIAALCYVELFRGVPVLLLLFFLYYGLPTVGIELGPYQAAVLGFGLNYAAYEAEIYRAAIESVPHGQWEAAAVLGMRPILTFRRVIMPQALRTALPPMTTDFVALFKDTSLVSVLAVVELTKQYQILAKSSMKYLEIGVVTALLYLLISLPVGWAGRALERRWSVGQAKR